MYLCEPHSVIRIGHSEQEHHRLFLIMGLPEIVDFARNLAVMVRVKGPVSFSLVFIPLLIFL